MVSEVKAKKRLKKALRALYRVRRKADAATPEQKASVEAAIDAVKAEYLAVLGVDETTSYRVVTEGFRNARGDLDRIIADRAELIDKLKSAEKVMRALTRVTKLI